ncbi:MAG: aldehyde dehydrogenase family protein [Microthrixaceae bacterium]
MAASTTSDPTAADGSVAKRASAAAPGRFDVLSPATGEVVGTHPIDGVDEVGRAVEAARTASTWWRERGVDGRTKVLKGWRAHLVNHAEELIEVVHAETGKPRSDAQLELVLAVEHLAWATKHAPKVMKRRRVFPGAMMSHIAATLEYQPLGVIGVIGPWNYPVFTPMGSIAYALAAGNAVVFKPSEYTPGVGRWLADSFAAVCATPVLQTVTGLGATGAALVDADVDKIAFTGSTATGRTIMAAAARRLTPVLMECGGKDALLVDADANLEAAADAATWGAMSNAGQTCAGVERVYVHGDVYDAFVDLMVSKASALTAGSGADAKFGPITMPGQVDIISRHIADALARGGRALVGGADAVDGRVVGPTVLVDVPGDSSAMTEETFGPTVVITRVGSMDEAVDRANDSDYALGASVFSKARGMELAARIRSGMVSINSVVAFAGIAALPFGGVGDSGFGRIHGEDGIREFTRSKAVARQRFAAPVALTSFERTAATDRLVGRAMKLMHGRG